jgi:hypothetical protein
MVRLLHPARALLGVAFLACTHPLGIGTSEGGAGGSMSGGAGGAGTGGTLAPDAGTPDATPGGSFVPETTALPDRDTVPGPDPLRRLTLLEYGNTVRDLLGVTAPAPRSNGGFLLRDVNAGDSGFTRGTPFVNSDDVRAFLVSGEAIGGAAALKLAALVPCSPLPTGPAEQETCAGKFITSFGLRAFRRPLAQQEVDKLVALYRTLRGDPAADTFEEAIGDLVTAMLNAPELLYHREQGANPLTREGTLIRFGPYELASRLSYLLWASMPDQALLDAARDGKLTTTEGLVQQASRLYADDRARGAVEDFHWQWLEGDQLEELVKAPALVDFTPEVARSMAGESRAFAASLFFGPKADGKLETLLTGTDSFVDAGLAKLYGLPAPAGMGLQPVSLSAQERSGIFTRAAFLARKAEIDGSNPVARGDALLRRLVCLDIPSPNDIVIPPIPEPLPGVTTRQRVESVDNQMCAQACHAFIDPLGFAFENYDAIGAYRTTDQGKPVDASGTLRKVLAAGDVPFKNAVDLMPKLARSDEVTTCMSRQWLRYLMRRRELSSEEPTVAALARTLAARGGDLRHLLFGLVRSRPFTHRTPMNGEPP